MISIVRDWQGQHRVGGLPYVPTGVHEYRQTTPIRAVRMREAFQIATLEGIMEGRAGDWLMIGAAGEMYPCDAEIFAKTYEQVRTGEGGAR